MDLVCPHSRTSIAFPLHFRYFSLIRSEAVSLYFERFDILSRTKDYNWLSSRTLHISGLEPHERNSILKKI